MIPDKTCAPVKVKYQARFFSNYSPEVLTDLKIRVAWGDGTWDEQVAQNTFDGTSYTYYIDVAHIYPKGGTSCRYNVVANPRLNGTLCTSTVDEKKVTVWDTDDENGGVVAIDPPIYNVCPGEEFSVTFNDISTWNCTPPLETDNINWPARWTQFIYGTGTTAGTRISGIEVNGAAQTYPYRGDIKSHLDWQLGPDHTSYIVKVPATAQVGEIFEVTLRNWNACNPYDDPAIAGPPANAQEGDFAPVTSVAIIRIVDRPQGAITTRNKDNVITESFCPGERVRFEGQQTNAGVTNVRYDWYIYNDAAGTELLEIKNNTKNWNREAGFPTAGQKLIKLRIRNNDAANACWGEVTKLIDVYAAPTVNATINGKSGNLQEFCWDGNNISVDFGFQLFSANNYKHQISLYQRNSTATSPDGAVLAAREVAGGQTSNALYSLTIAEPGVYKVRLTATDKITACETIVESSVLVYDQPLPSFSLDPLCEGQTVYFTDASTLPTSVNGDALASWEWDVDYDGSTFAGDYTGATGVQHTYPAAGSYQVALRLTTTQGCASTLVQTMKVKPVPQAALDYDYTQPICPGEPVTFTNLSNNSAATFPAGVTYTLVVNDGGTMSRYPMMAATLERTFINSSSASKTFEIWLEAAGNDPNNCASISNKLYVEVKPGAMAGFIAPGYDPLGTNCSPLDLALEVNQATINIDADRYTWTVLRGTTELQNVVQLKGAADFGKLQYTATNNTANSLTYTVRLVAEKADQCIVPAEERYRVNPVPAADFTVTQLNQSCEETILEVQVANASGISSYNWTIFPEPENISSVVYDDKFQIICKRPSVTAPSYYVDISLTTENFFECESQPVTKQYTILPQELDEVKMVVISPENEGCGPLPVEFENQTSNPPAGTQFAVMMRRGSLPEQELIPESGSADGTFSYTFVDEGNYKIWLKATAPDGCVRYQDIPAQVVVYPRPRANFDADKLSGCAPLEVYFTNLSEGNTGAGSGWFIKQPGASTFDAVGSTLSSYSFANTTSSTVVYEVRYVAANDAGCSDSFTRQITVHAGVAANFSMSQSGPLCGLSSVTFTNESMRQGVRYIWKWGDGSLPDTTRKALTIDHQFNNDRTDQNKYFEVTLFAEDTLSSCTSTFRQTVQVYPAIQVSVTPDKTEICAPDEVKFTNSSQNVATHEWFYRLQGTADKQEVRQTAEVTYHFTNNTNAVQVYEVVYTGTSSTGCSATAVNTITVYPFLAPSFTVDTDRPVLPNAEVMITNTTPHASAWAYTWDFGDGTGSTAVHPGSKTYQRYGTYTITMSISNGKCIESFAKEIIVEDIPPRIDFESVPVSGCEPLLVQFQNTSQYADNTTFEWDFGDGATSRAVNPSHTFYAERDPATGAAIVTEYTVTLTGRNYTGVSETVARKTVTVYPNPVAGFSVRETVVQVPGEPVFVANHSTGADSFWWDFGDGTSYTEKNPIHYYQEPGIYSITLVATSAWGCSDTLRLQEVVTAEAGGEIKIPNAFTPSLGGPNDGSIDAPGDNDVFFPVLEGGIKSYNMRIYNRWGELLFETTDRRKGWNGYYKGRLCKSDVYAYKVYVEFSDGKTLQQIGDVTLIR